jgi:hypothetical protein
MKKFIEIPNLGKTTQDDRVDEWYYSEPVIVGTLGNKLCQIVVNGYVDDTNKEQFHNAISNFLFGSPSVLTDAQDFIFQYYQDINSFCTPSDEGFLLIETPDKVWEHVQLGEKPIVERRAYGDQGIYISLECACDWEPEHGLQIVFKDGVKVNKVGGFDGHLTNSDAYNDPALENVIYYRIS